MTDAIIVFGKQGCGKTRNAHRIRLHFKCGGIIDDWMVGDPLKPGHVHLTNDDAALRLAASPKVSGFQYDDLPAAVRGLQ